MSNSIRQRIPDRMSSIKNNEQSPNVLVFMCGIRGVLESEEKWSCLDGE